jgi:5-methylcytosine-specific restriction endonuclease McrA
MRNFTKTNKAPDCLSEQKKLKTGKYDCGKVLQLLSKDFHNKCYLCEDKDITSINIEHFVPKSLGKDFKFDWKNLLFACRHCNEIKSNDYNTIVR